MKRTSISLPTGQMEDLASAQLKCGLSKQNLALKCLKRFKKKPKQIKLNRRHTIGYNSDRCKSKLYFYHSETLHNYAQALRYSEKMSVSFLISQAIDRYLEKILEIILRQKVKYLELLDKNMGHFHRHLSFRHENILALRFLFIRKTG